jgi:murein DD-endopeptidase MepM/ murein hydrolase activator NlpD
MKMPKKWTIMIMPTSIEGGHNITVTSLSLIVGLVTLCTLIATSLTIFGTYTHRWRQHYIGQINSLENKIAARETRLANLSKEFGAVLVLEDKLRVIAGLESRHETIGQPGMGGREYPAESPDSTDMGATTEAQALSPIFWSGDENQDTETFLLAITAARDSFREILNTFEKEQDRLSNIPSINPVYSGDAWISSGFGYRRDPINGARRFHDGVDIVAPRRTPIIAPADGKVTFSGWREGTGRTIEIKHGYGYRTRYGHNDKLTVRKGDTVRRGDTIALLGNSGRSTGPHLHYEIRENGKLLNPYRYVIE